MNISLNKKEYKINQNEFSTITHNEYNNLIIRERLGHFERITSLLKDLSAISRWCLFFSQSHGGVVALDMASSYDKVYLLGTSEKHRGNLEENLARFNIQNVGFGEPEFNGQPEFTGEFVVFSENYDDVDEELVKKYSPIILTNLNQKLLRSGLYSNVYELVDSNLAVYVPERLNSAFFDVFHYYIRGEKLVYDNLINLCIMVKNGGKQFENMLTENMHLIDRWTILDTGSTDDTIEVINRVLVGKKRGELFQEPFINFRDSRNRLLELAGESCKFTLMLDDTYIVKGDLRGFLNEVRGDQFADSFTLYVKSDDVEYGSNRLLKTDRKLKYLYKIHEVVQEKDNMNVIIPINRCYIFDDRFDYMEERTMNRKQLDLKFLYEEVEEEPDNPRSFYYLAQTYNVMAEYEKSYFYFLKRMNHPIEGFLQEKIDAIFEAARTANFKLNKPWSECEALYLKAYELDKTRPDSLYFLGIHHYLDGDKTPAFEYFKKGFEVGYPVHCQYSLKPTLSYHFLPKFLSQLCYEFNDWSLGERCCKLYLENNQPNSDGYETVASMYNIFVKLLAMNNSLANMGSNYLRIMNSTKSANGKPLLGFVADGGFAPWTGSDILNKGVGGSETYIIEMARYIQKQGFFKVIVFCNCVSHTIFEGVEYIPIVNYPPFIKNVEFHTCVISRFSEYLPAAIYGKAENVYLVLHDLTPSGNVIPVHDKLKKIFCLSEWHVEYFLNIFPQFKDITMPFYYGIDETFGKYTFEKYTFEKSVAKPVEDLAQPVEDLAQPFKKIENKFIYSSFPNRGLLQLLQMWPRIVEKFPNASLHIYSDVNGKWVNNVAGELMQQIRDLLKETENNKTLNIFYNGWVKKAELAEAWKSSQYWFYPCTFMETFCLTAVEAALSKTLAITNGLAALQNTVGDRGICIPGDPTTVEWQDSALGELFSIMRDDASQKREELIERNYEWASKMSWENQAKKLGDIFIKV